MLAILTTKVPKDILKSVVIIGSITGHKWSPTSDIDVNVLISPFDPNIEKTKITQDINNYLAVNTRHPVTFFVQEWTGNKSWQDAKFGVYEVLNDTWLVLPADRATVRHPSEEFRQEIEYAQRIARQFKVLADSYFKDTKDLRKLRSENKWLSTWYIKRKKREVSEDLKELILFVDNVDKGRKMSYRYGWGIPRSSVRNIIFKLLEHGPYGPLFKKLEPMTIQDVVSE